MLTAFCHSLLPLYFLFVCLNLEKGLVLFTLIAYCQENTTNIVLILMWTTLKL